MPQFAVVSHERHTGKRWLRSTSHRFAAADAMALVVEAELVEPRHCVDEAAKPEEH
jgi:hypothetical protein